MLLSISKRRGETWRRELAWTRSASREQAGTGDDGDFGDAGAGDAGHVDFEDAGAGAAAWVGDFAEDRAVESWRVCGEPGVVVSGVPEAGEGGVD